MSDDADWDNPVWRLEAGVLEGLAAAVELLVREAEGLAFHAYWVGEKPETRKRLPLRELVADIRSNRIRNKHVYLVGTAV